MALAKRRNFREIWVGRGTFATRLQFREIFAFRWRPADRAVEPRAAGPERRAAQHGRRLQAPLELRQNYPWWRIAEVAGKPWCKPHLLDRAHPRQEPRSSPGSRWLRPAAPMARPSLPDAGVLCKSFAIFRAKISGCVLGLRKESRSKIFAKFRWRLAKFSNKI